MQADKFARKIFLSKKKQDGLEEWCNLVQIHRFDQKPHGHIVKILGAFQYGDSFSIIFPLADYSLEDYLQRGSSLAPEDMWSQMRGIASGLAFLHGLREDEPNEDKKEEYVTIAYHLDLKPKNILIIKNVFQITDFGLAKVRRKMLLSRSEAESDGAGNAGGYSTYGPPEQGKRAGKDYAGHDLWSLGAIYSEMATHDIHARGTPHGSVNQYRTDLSLDEDTGGTIRSRCFHKNGKMKDAVSSQHNHLFKAVQSIGSRHQNTLVTPWQKKFYTEDFFGLIHKMLSHVSTGRGTAKIVENKLKEWLDKIKSQLSLVRDPRMRDNTAGISRDIFQEAEDLVVQKDYNLPDNTHYM